MEVCARGLWGPTDHRPHAVQRPREELNLPRPDAPIHRPGEDPVRGVADDLKLARVVVVPDESAEDVSRRVRLIVPERSLEVVHLSGQPRQDTRLLELVEAEGEEARRDDDQEEPRALEEPPEIDLPRGGEQPVPEERRDHETDPRADDDIRSDRRRESRHEEHRLDPLPKHGDEREGGEAHHLAAVHEERDPPLDEPADVLRGLQHPKDHRCQDDDRQDRSESFKHLLPYATELDMEEGEKAGDHDAPRECRPRPEEHVPVEGSLPDLREVRKDDPDDQGALDALPQPDDETRDDAADDHDRDSFSVDAIGYEVATTDYLYNAGINTFGGQFIPWNGTRSGRPLSPGIPWSEKGPRPPPPSSGGGGCPRGAPRCGPSRRGDGRVPGGTRAPGESPPRLRPVGAIRR